MGDSGGMNALCLAVNRGPAQITILHALQCLQHLLYIEYQEPETASKGRPCLQTMRECQGD